MKTITFIALLCALSFSAVAQDQGGNAAKKYYHREPMPADITVPTAEKAAALNAKFVGTHKIRLQWLQNTNSKNMGKMTVTEKDGQLITDGYQEEMNNGHKNFMKIKGTIVVINASTILFNGKIDIQVDYTDQGNLSVREGFYVFKKMGKRPFYRMQKGRDVFDQVEYIDIF
jgi:hypothetical protein